MIHTFLSNVIHLFIYFIFKNNQHASEVCAKSIKKERKTAIFKESFVYQSMLQVIRTVFV